MDLKTCVITEDILIVRSLVTLCFVSNCVGMVILRLHPASSLAAYNCYNRLLIHPRGSPPNVNFV